MRIALYFNPGAGDEMPLEKLTTAITRAGHQIAAVIHEKDDLASARQTDIDVLVAAGGDGTVAKAARKLAGCDLPIAILPLGTANNIATTLGITGSALGEVERWHTRQIVRIDTGVVTDEHGERVFIEGVGTGLVPAGITKGNNDPRKHEAPNAASEVEWARRVFIDALADLRPRHSRVCIDDEEIEGEYLLVEVLNVASVGPRLRLTDETTPADGFLSVVAGGPDDRAAIDAHLRLPWNQDDSHAWLKSWRARRVVARGWHEYHVDDKVRSSESGEVTIEVRPASLAVLA